MSDSGAHLKLAISCIESLGAARGLFLELEKSKFVQALGISEKAAKADTSPLDWIHGEGARQIGSVVGSGNAKKIWVEKNLETWLAG